MVEIIAITILGIVCIAQAVERYFYAKDMSQKLQDCIKAVMSRNINEYIAAVNVPKNVKDVKVDSDEVFLDESSDEVFDKFIKNANQ